MNSIFLLLWLADIVDNLSGFCSFLLVAFVVAFVIYMIIVGVEACSKLSESEKVGAAKLRRMFRILALSLILPSIVYLVLPSKATVQAAATAQTFNVAASTQLGQDAIDALERVLKKIGN
jgi:hypothetical protein